MNIQRLQHVFGGRLQTNAPMSRFTSARVGGPADALVEVHSIDELVRAATVLWSEGEDWIVLGSGSNVLVSDAGIRGVVVLNHTQQVRFSQSSIAPCVWAESGANLGLIARQAATRGLTGLEWAAGIPGSIGGAVVGNAGAHGGELAGNLLVADILHRSEKAQEGMPKRETWHVEQLEYTYRSSWLKRNPGKAVVLACKLKLDYGNAEAIKAKMDEYLQYRRRTQPPGASMGSMFKNPPGDYAGRLIDVAGLKGFRIGDAEISSMHGNFFINHGRARASEVYTLIEMAQQVVAEKFGVQLDLEIELIGDWTSQGNDAGN